MNHTLEHLEKFVAVPNPVKAVQWANFAVRGNESGRIVAFTAGLALAEIYAAQMTACGEIEVCE